MMSLPIRFVVDNVIASALLFFESFRRHAVQSPSVSHVITFQILSMKVVLHDVPVLVTVLAFILHRVPKLDHVLVMHLMRYHIVVGRLSSFEAWRNLRICAHRNFHLSRMVNSTAALFVLRVSKLLGHRVEAILFHMLLRAL